MTDLMRFLKCSFLLCWLLGSPLIHCAQNTPSALEKLQDNYPDSAAVLIKASLRESNKVDSTSYLEYLLLRGSVLKGNLDIDQSLDSLIQLRPFNSLYFKLLNLKGSVLYYRGNKKEALVYFTRLYRESDAAGNAETSRKILSNISAIYSSIHQPDSALHYALLSLEADKAAKDTAAFSYAYNYIGLAYQDLNLNSKAIVFFKEGLQYEPDILTKANILYNTGRSYSLVNRIDSSQSYLLKANTLFENLENITGIINTSTAIGTNMVKLNKLNKGKKYHEKALKYSQAIQDSIKMAASSHELSKIYLLEKNYEQALQFSREAQAINEKLELHTFSKNTTRILSIILAAQGKADSALHYSAISDSLVEAINKEKYLEDLSEAETRLNLAEKELAIATQNETIAEYRNKLLGYGIGGVILLSGLIVIFLLIRNNQRKKHDKALLDEKQKSLNKEILAAESERSRISKELHDGIGQQISALSLNMQYLKRSKNQRELMNGLSSVSEQLKLSAAEVRDISHQMMPRALMENGLIEAAGLLLAQSFKNTQIDYSFQYEPDQFSIDQNIEVSLYRILQELINNIIKHSKAKTVQVEIFKTDKKITLNVQDNGVGIKPAGSDGHGMHNIRSRIDMFKGSFKIENSNGTFASINIPLLKS